jgi:hypothetical protein
MGFDLGAFIAGASEGAASSIDKRNKEIRQAALREFEQLQKQAGEQEEKLRTKRDEMKATADVLSSYRGSKNAGFTQAQVVGLLQNPSVAKEVARKIKENEDRLDKIDFSTIYEISKGKTDISINDYINKATSIAVPTTEAPQKVVRGAFGLESPAFGQAQAEFEKASGKSLKEVRAFAKGPEGISEEEKIQGVLNFSQFKKPETLANITGELRDLIANGEDLNSDKAKPLLNKLAANAVIEARFGEKEGDKPRTTAQINSVFSRSLAVSVDPFVVKGVVRLVPDSGDYVPIGGSVEDIAAFQKQKNDTIKAQAEAIGILDKNGKILGGRNSEDALVPYANIKDGKIVSWKSAAQATTPAPAPAPGTAAPAAPAKPAEQNAEVLPLPKTKDGKLDGSKLVAGKQYRAADNTVKTWNGTNWQ